VGDLPGKEAIHRFCRARVSHIGMRLLRSTGLSYSFTRIVAKKRSNTFRPMRLLLSAMVFAMSRAAMGESAFCSTKRASSSKRRIAGHWHVVVDLGGYAGRCAPACGCSALPEPTTTKRHLRKMAIRGLFIGINRHADPATRELRGARRDAVALHALMLDARPSMRATLLTDGDATCSSVNLLFLIGLSRGGPERHLSRLRWADECRQVRSMSGSDVVLDDVPPRIQLSASRATGNHRQARCCVLRPTM
jgi:hypothetical protein